MLLGQVYLNHLTIALYTKDNYQPFVGQIIDMENETIYFRTDGTVLPIHYTDIIRLQRLEDDFYQYANLNIPLTFLMDDILHALSASDKDYFILNKKHAKDHRNHYFYFERHTIEENEEIVRFSYLGEKKG